MNTTIVENSNGVHFTQVDEASEVTILNLFQIVMKILPHSFEYLYLRAQFLKLTGMRRGKTTHKGSSREEPTMP